MARKWVTQLTVFHYKNYTGETSTHGNAVEEETIDELQSSPKSLLDCICVLCFIIRWYQYCSWWNNGWRYYCNGCVITNWNLFLSVDYGVSSIATAMVAGGAVSPERTIDEGASVFEDLSINNNYSNNMCFLINISGQCCYCYWSWIGCFFWPFSGRRFEHKYHPITLY